ncbi:MAG TPA: hypothetical protein PLD47_04425 [Aggregatilineales bacterium]|nr:hypothetical protein [Anaerolineales bacterium]HRE46948.1 hypothetical protein [Aggregatilineales bacterium]
MTTLSRRQLNRATLARQLLLERAAISPLEAVARVAGLQAQVTNPPYIGLWTRLADFPRAALTQWVEGGAGEKSCRAGDRAISPAGKRRSGGAYR